MPSYQDEITAIKYLEFLDSPNGQIQQKVLLDAILPRLPKNRIAMILDAGCGSGWLSADLKKNFPNISACDDSEFFIKFAKANHQGVDFRVADLSIPLPYPPNNFDIVILNMGAPDLKNLNNSFKNLSAVLKSSGTLLITIPNPKYTYPAAEWKRSLLDIIMLRKPSLKFKNPPLSGEKIMREFGQDIKIESYYYTQANYIAAAQAAGFKLSDVTDIRSESDSPNFDLAYQLHRYPLLLLLKFTKT